MLVTTRGSATRQDTAQSPWISVLLLFFEFSSVYGLVRSSILKVEGLFDIQSESLCQV
jgi:hypothetical protein